MSLKSYKMVKGARVHCTLLFRHRGEMRMSASWLFVLASAIAVVGISFAFNKMMHQVQEKVEKGEQLDLNTMQAAQTKFFIQVAMAEAIPILIIVYAFTLIGQVVETNVVVPLVVIIGILVVAFVSLLRIRRDMSRNGKYIILYRSSIAFCHPNRFNCRDHDCKLVKKDGIILCGKQLSYHGRKNGLEFLKKKLRFLITSFMIM
jgi:hypothetical protein